MAASKGVKLTAELSPESSEVVADKDKLIQIITNFIHNAIKFTPQGVVSILTKLEGADIFIEVTDQGPGIREEDQAKLFQPFSQIYSKGRRFSGSSSGLGLSISKKIIELHGGHVGVRSELGKGSTFYARFPRKQK